MNPSVSVVIPLYNRAHLLDMCLKPLFVQTYPRDAYEIIVVDDGSTDDSAAAAEKMGAEWGGKFRVIRQKNQGPGAARSTGIDAAEGEYIACIDSDCTADADWLEVLIAQMHEQHADAIGGPVLVGGLENPMRRYYAAADFYRPRMKDGEVEYIITGNVIFRREALLAVGGFERSGMLAGDDVDLSYRLKAAGYRLAMSGQGAVVHHGDPTTLKGFWKRLYQHGFFSVQLNRQWPGVRPVPVQFIRHAGAIILSPLIAFRAAQRDSLRWWPWFWLCVVVQHAAFNVGLLAGVIKRKS